MKINVIDNNRIVDTLMREIDGERHEVTSIELDLATNDPADGYAFRVWFANGDVQVIRLEPVGVELDRPEPDVSAAWALDAEFDDEPEIDPDLLALANWSSDVMN